ncbi:phBC6A51 family helix-turn-helix protein [Lactococcus sp.]|uniref:phBC6A51 family helix-turn-helix protein n=1 Tax=Lactococcus sp. TaxID=44273 RepID=UPI002FC8BFA9
MLTTNQEKAVVMLFDGRTVKKIAKELKVTERTIYNWKKDPEVISALRKMSNDYLGVEIPKLLKNQMKLATKSKSEIVRFYATKDLLDRADFVPNTEDKGESDAQLASEKYDELIRETAKARLDIQASVGDE